MVIKLIQNATNNQTSKEKKIETALNKKKHVIIITKKIDKKQNTKQSFHNEYNIKKNKKHEIKNEIIT